MTREWTSVYAAISTASRTAALPDDTCRLFFSWLLLHLDAHGCISAKVNQIHSKVWPILDDKALGDTVRALNECVIAGLLRHRRNTAVEWYESPDWDDKAGGYLIRKGRGTRPWPLEGEDLPPDTSRRLPEPPGASRRRVQTDIHTDRHRTDKQTVTRAPAREKPPAEPVEIPPCLDLPEFRAAYADWTAYKARRRESFSPPHFLGKCERAGVHVAVAALRDAMSNGSQGFFPEKFAGTGPRPISSQAVAFDNIPAEIAARPRRGAV